ncbi:hypothetical protein BB561_000491 [Smittium simulii]|uniref:Oxysterol-binding protein n=1 Tax=Smittium simulii TaxID=133385 RepID=A0A2T9YYW3_9FUNG|nr:hypothetical protein BB561_000491 [Smittium simulii]
MNSPKSKHSSSPVPKVAPSYSSALISYVKSILTFKGSIISSNCPALFLSGVSLLELAADWGDYFSFLVDASNSQNSTDKSLNVAKWVLSSFRSSYFGMSLGDRISIKKPYNPILGEQFYCEWFHEEYGTTKLTCEQVSHHPPISAFSLENDKYEIICNGYSEQRLKFAGTSLTVDQVGVVSVLFKKTNQLSVISLPSLSISGLLVADPIVEICGTVLIRSSDQTNCILEFIKKPYFYGNYFKFKGIITPYSNNERKRNDPEEIQLNSAKNQNSEKSCVMEGNWTTSSTFNLVENGKASKSNSNVSSSTNNLKNYKNARSDSPKPQNLLDFEDLKPLKRVIAPLSSQSEFESHKVWHDVTEALGVLDFNKAAESKNLIENAQRELRKTEKTNNYAWSPRLFTFIEFNDIKNSEFRDAFQNVQSEKPNISNGLWVKNELLDMYKS